MARIEKLGDQNKTGALQPKDIAAILVSRGVQKTPYQVRVFLRSQDTWKDEKYTRYAFSREEAVAIADAMDPSAKKKQEAPKVETKATKATRTTTKKVASA